jgi:redox-sensitive bicupin YhaK (pirin superfamily)
MKQRLANERGFFKNSWLTSYHSFSFSEYYDPKNMHFRNLRVINHDFIAANSGFGTHPHHDMEIMTYVLRGVVEHQDSMGNKTQIKAGEVQIMSAGTGITHSEFNPDPRSELELLQIWILPQKKGITPYYEQKIFSEKEKLNQLKLLASPTQEQSSLLIHQDVKVYGSVLEKEKSIEFENLSGRHVWFQVAKGEIKINDMILKTGDGLAVDEPARLNIKGVNTLTDFLVFDLN